ncbi:MAG: putative glycolipid-binding domain-containing protein [Acidimicrobiia bacterium]
MAVILWRRSDGLGLERCVFEPTGDGHRIAGTVLLGAAGGPVEIRYSILVDAAWRTKTVGAHVQGPGNDRRLALNADGNGHWATGDDPIVDLYGAIDVAFSWTPATTTVAVNRLRLEPGDRAEAVAASIAYPGRDIRRLTMQYTRLAGGDYRCEIGNVAADFTVDGDGTVVEHGAGWVAVD